MNIILFGWGDKRFGQFADLAKLALDGSILTQDKRTISELESALASREKMALGGF